MQPRFLRLILLRFVALCNLRFIEGFIRVQRYCGLRAGSIYRDAGEFYPPLVFAYSDDAAFAAN